MKEVLKLDHIKKYYGNGGTITKAIEDISFSVQAGEFVGIMGASGSGKTTLLNCISTIDTVSAGHIYLDGTDVTEINEKEIARFRRENLGFVFQDFNLLDTLTISENIALALTINQVPAGEIDGRVREMAVKLNITDILDKYPYQVSGGQKQRCACARAIINQPKLIWFSRVIWMRTPSSSMWQERPFRNSSWHKAGQAAGSGKSPPVRSRKSCFWAMHSLQRVFSSSKWDSTHSKAARL